MDGRLTEIYANTERILAGIPPHVTVIAAVKSRTPDEVEAAINAGIRCIGHNYIQEAQKMQAQMPPETLSRVRWHFIGHLQRNKAALALNLFDLLETVDTPALAQDLDRRLAERTERFPIFIEVNSGREENKSGVFPEQVEEVIRAIAGLERLQVQGLMTMGPPCEDPADLRPYFQATRRLFEQISRQQISGVDLRFLSMGMSDSYSYAIEEGANLVRIGTKLFGPRPPK